MNLGNLLIWFSLIVTAASIAAYFPHMRRAPSDALRWARLGTYASALGLLLALGYLWTLILTHRFEYDYVFRYSSRSMPMRYIVSSLWGGQEGTFLLWAAFGGVLSVWLRFRARAYEAAVQFFYMGITLFLLLMLTKASPFSMLDTVPADGNGLNPLLQDPWMTIHPPITFLGFAALGIPAAFAMAALVRQDWDAWIPRALPWSIFGVVALGAGLTLGGYWSYSILGWGGYWGWDPVENSSLVPWLIGIALIHSQVIQLRRKGNRRLNLLLALLPFVFLTYSTFLTRSGVLADFSVHSFTDLGINQFLVAFMAIFFGGGLILYVIRWRHIPPGAPSGPFLSRENFLQLGSWVFLLFAAAVCLGTSAPLLSRLWGQPSTVEPDFYNGIVLPFALVVAVLMGVAPHMIWAKADPRRLVRNLRWSLVLAVLGTVAAALLGVRGLLLAVVAAGVFALVANAQVAILLTRGKVGASGGYWAHVGVGFMILGILTSTGYDRQKLVVLPRGQDVEALGYTFRYLGNRPVEEGTKTAHDIQVSRGDAGRVVSPTLYINGMNGGMMKKPAIYNRLTHDVYVAPGDLAREGALDRTRRGMILARGERVAYRGGELEFRKFEMEAEGHTGGAAVTAVIDWHSPDGPVEIRPSARMGSGGLVPAEDAILPGTEVRVSVHGIDATNGRVTIAAGVPPVRIGRHGTVEHEGFRLHLREVDVDVRMREAVVRAEVQVEREGQTYVLEPGFVDRGEMGREFIETPIGDTGFTLVLGGAYPATGEADLFVTPTPEETLWIEASTKPFIGWLWVGTVLVLAGMILAGGYRGRLARRTEAAPAAAPRAHARRPRKNTAAVALTHEA